MSAELDFSFEDIKPTSSYSVGSSLYGHLGHND